MIKLIHSVFVYLVAISIEYLRIKVYKLNYNVRITWIPMDLIATTMKANLLVSHLNRNVLIIVFMVMMLKQINNCVKNCILTQIHLFNVIMEQVGRFVKILYVKQINFVN